MGDEATDDVLKRVRENNHAERIKRRKEMYIKQRKLTGHLRRSELKKEFTEEEIINAARQICSGPSDLREKSLTDLKIAFILDKCHMISFMKVEGALHALVGGLMSQKPVEQLLSAECCSNLAMGDSRTCFKLAKAAAPYLITILQGLNHNLMNVCVLSLFNLSGSGEKTCELLCSQGVLKVLERTMTIPELRENTIRVLISFIRNGSKYITEAEVKDVLSCILPHFELLDKVQWLVYQLSSLPYVTPVLFQNDIPARVITLLSSFLRIRKNNIMSATALVRILGNLSADPEGITACKMLDRWETTNMILNVFVSSEYRHLSKEIYWSLGNILNHKNPKVLKKMLLTDLSRHGCRISFSNT